MQQPADVDELTDALLGASRVLVAISARSIEAGAGDVTVAQFRALVVLASRGPQTAAALAEELGVARSSATRLCDRLVHKGLISRAPATEDRREVRLEISPAGRDVVATVSRQRRREIRRIVGSMSAEDGRTLVDALHAFAEAADEPPDRQWFLGWS